MKKITSFFSKAEEYLCAAILCVIVALSFITAVGRCINHPISWTIELSQFLLAWLAFIGGDMAFRSDKIMGVDIITRKFPEKVRAAIKLVMNILILITLILFIKYGYSLCMSNIKRSYQTVGISYSYATASLPVASIFMSITALTNIVNSFRLLSFKKVSVCEKKEELI
ncbi:TRAP transporter small permease [Treponema parvum]|uniref:TRAP transporter small permease n=1 Tax=Treponema parvum TaxID=138851 RepID=UPI001AEBE832|nr:TRAP transporter small permease [Treponema parvum]QTQ15905.1 TRAP transporter small permease [Treponema parvum]